MARWEDVLKEPSRLLLDFPTMRRFQVQDLSAPERAGEPPAATWSLAAPQVLDAQAPRSWDRKLPTIGEG
jgi:hypothetical protein